MKTTNQTRAHAGGHGGSSFLQIGWALLLLGLWPVKAWTATNVVTSLADNGPGSLRQMITDAASGDTLIFGVTGTITLTSGELLLVKSLNIIGPEAGNLTISGNHASRLLKVQSNVVASLSGLNLRDGKASNGVVGTVVEGQGTPGEIGREHV